MTVEHVLAIPRAELTKQNVGTEGIYPIDFSKMDVSAFGWLPRHVADAKDPETKKTSADAVGLGKYFPQILGYFQIVDSEGRILSYYRKGKEKGLAGKRSIGVGGHVDLQDSVGAFLTTDDTIEMDIDNNILSVIITGAYRELKEEIGLTVTFDPFAFNKVISTYADPTSAVHVGLAVELSVTDEEKATLKFEELEYLDVQWLTREELKADLEANDAFETWSKLLIEQF